MRILVIGGEGMLGHQLVRRWSDDHEVRATIHGPRARSELLAAADPTRIYPGVDVRRLDSLVDVMSDFRPDAVVNAAGIIKQRPEAKEPTPSIEVNSLFPHRLAALAAAAGSRIVQISTDCVFSGRQGGYAESDPPDPVDLYGQTKLLGEVVRPNAVTLRTSIIGLELGTQRGLVEWFLSQDGEVPGYRRAIYTGVTTSELAVVIECVLTSQPELHGLWHVASEPVSKFDLLGALAKKLGRDVTVVPNDEVVCDRSLNGERFTSATDYRVKTWDAMLDGLVREIQERRDR